MLTLKILDAEDWRLWRELRLKALEEAPYAFSSTLADWQAAGDSEPRWRARLQDVPFNVVAFLDDNPSGMVSATEPNHENRADLVSMWVAPHARGRGVGDALMTAVLAWAAQRHCTAVTLRVVEDNERALALYLRHGFRDTGVKDRLPDGVRTERLLIRDLNAPD